MRRADFTAAFSLLSALATPAAVAAGVPRPSGDKPICKTQPKAGSHVIARICHTRAEWDAMRDASRRIAADAAAKPSPNENGLRTTLQ